MDTAPAELDEVRRLLWSTCSASRVAGTPIGGVCLLGAPALVDVFDLAERLRDDALEMFRIVAGVISVALLAAGLGNVQQGLERFGALAVSAAAGSPVFLAALIALLAAG